MDKIPCILLVDDDKTTNYINELIIRRADLTDELLIAHNGRDAIEMIRKRCEESGSGVPELIILDINMPVMDGFEFLERVKAIDCLNAHSAVVAVLTTSLDSRDIARVKASGVSEFLSKPLTKQDLNRLFEKHFH